MRRCHASVLGRAHGSDDRDRRPSGYERPPLPPLPPACGTVGSDHFLLRVVRDAAPAGVGRNGLVVNYRTPERRSGSGFIAHQVWSTGLLLSMLYYHPVTGIGGNLPSLPYSLHRCPDPGEMEMAAAGAPSTPAGPRRSSPASPAASSVVARRAGRSRRPGPHSALNRQLLQRI